MPKDVRRLLIKLAWVIAPAIPLIGLYVALDPFKVLRTYDSYYKSGEAGYVTLNNDFVATETFRNHYAKNHYDSFIFGNSRSRFYQVADWRTHIGSDRCFHFDASNESLFGIHGKFRYLDRHGVKIDNALIVLDSVSLSTITNSEGHLFIKHPEISRESPLTFHLTCFTAFLNLKFLTANLYFAVTGKTPESLAGESINTVPIDYDVNSNEYRLNYFETMIGANPAVYYQPREKLFYSRIKPVPAYPPVVHAGQKLLLLDIRDVLKRNGARYKIVISPLYDQKKIDPSDLNFLNSIFGAENVWDFSGINKFTENYMNYYELSHYRPHVARELMNIIYAAHSKTP